MHAAQLDAVARERAAALERLGRASVTADAQSAQLAALTPVPHGRRPPTTTRSSRSRSRTRSTRRRRRAARRA